ncbi:ABC-2 family transporter protein [Aquisphaera giovannonii]|uniref:ABC-2 family transporter protein n=1 Tax=Aquisphaera giovannonii TaxID=406548 RepID=A0A5B9W6T9_9BACT|nr:M1 family aminopeptidase [Aquisphaera giovannonii]QEH36323.1 ABC-2 family transporter protein [Aquisphaera giovannonii]
MNDHPRARHAAGPSRFSPRRFWTVFSGEFAQQARKPTVLVWVGLLVLLAWGMSTGSVRIQSGDAGVGGTKAWLTSEFAVAMQLAILTPLVYSFFLAILSGMTILHDEEWRLGDLLHATSLRPGEYVWGKYLAVLTLGFLVLAAHLGAMVFFNHVMPNAAAKELRGPLQAANYLRPALLMSAPLLVFLAGVSMLLGERSRRAILVFLLPLALLMADIFFLWEWSPGWLDPRVNRLLMWLDPGGFRWLQETWLKVDRGAAFYNSSPIPPDSGFLASRVALVVLGLAAVAWTRAHFAAAVHGRIGRRDGSKLVEAAVASETASEGEMPGREVRAGESLASLGMTSVRPGFLRGAMAVGRVELAALLASPGIYLFAVLILLQTIGTTASQVGFLDTALLITPGRFAMSSLNPLVTCSCLLLLFYSVESFERERATRLAPIAFSTPVRTGSLMLGKAAAQAAVATVIIVAMGLAGYVLILVQGTVPFSIRPFLIVWGLLLLPSLAAWSCFVMAVQSLTKNRYATYAIGLASIAFTAYRLFTGEINWVGNWPLWSAANWSDISVLELDRRALVLSRLLAVGLAIGLVAATARVFGRREADPVRIIQRLRPRPVVGTSLRLAGWGSLALVAGLWLALEVSWGPGGEAARKRGKDYWRKNLATYHDAKVPDITHVDLDLELFPQSSRFKASGTYDLTNPNDAPLRQILLTAGMSWEKIEWTLDGKPCEPTDRSKLFVFTPDPPLPHGGKARIGFRYEGAFPGGISKKGGSAMEFILPSSVVLTSFGPAFVPTVGFADQIGVDDENRVESKEYPDDFFEGQTDSSLGPRSPFTTRIRITGPADFTFNSVGAQVEDAVRDGRRTTTWESDHPVSFFNVVAGRWDVRRGEGTAVFHHPAHTYNVAEMVASLDAARRYYSEWFYPFPWKELKLSEFPNLATYAQGFPTNITFSEGIGFLTEDSAEIHAPFEITAHEAAHQWWGNIVSPGKGPGGNVVSEGTSHFSMILLVEQAKGLNARIDLCKRLEASYAKSRRPDSEKPLVKTDGSRPGDTTVTYDKGGWAFWMLMNRMGRDRALQGLRAFFKAYHNNPDHPVIQDLLAAMRPFAADPGDFDRFTRQWFREVVLPEYRLHEPKKAADGDRWKVTVRLENAGSGTMPVEVAATRGKRFDAKGQRSPDYREARATASPGKGESKEIAITCPFEPEGLVVDPDAMVLQLQRKTAAAKF